MLYFPIAHTIHRDIGSRRSVAMHWGTFALADERYDEPPRLLKKAAKKFAREVSSDEYQEDVADFVIVRHGGSIESPEREGSTPIKEELYGQR